MIADWRNHTVLMTAHPKTIKNCYNIGFPRPRGLELIASPEFASQILAIWSSLQEEVVRAMEQQG